MFSLEVLHAIQLLELATRTEIEISILDNRNCCVLRPKRSSAFRLGIARFLSSLYLASC
jgi:hypothetical protein